MNTVLESLIGKTFPVLNDGFVRLIDVYCVAILDSNHMKIIDTFEVF